MKPYADPPARAHLSPRYVASLAGIALVVLFVGALLRPAKASRAPAVSTSELVSLPALSQRRSLRDLAAYVRERAEAVAPSVRYLPSVGASGLVWTDDSVLSVSPSRLGTAFAPPPAAAGSPVLLPRWAPVDSTVPVTRGAIVDTLPMRWGVVVARAPDDGLLTLAGMAGGRMPVRCGGAVHEVLAFDAALPVAFAGGGLFDLDGQVLALAVPCDGSIVLLPLEGVARALDASRDPAQRLWRRHGLRVTPLDSLGRAVLGRDSGLVVTEVWSGGEADVAGLWPGDVVSRLGDRAVARVDDLAPLLAAPDSAGLGVQRLRGTVALMMVPESRGGDGLRLAAPAAEGGGLRLARVPPGSRAALAGLRAGDRIRQIGRSRAPSAAALRRALADSTPVLIVYERDGRRRGAFLR